jgi:hypothetical protein
MADQDPVPHDPNQAEWYAANLAAWFATRLEHDKSLLTLSAGGIGLLITLVSTVGIHSAESLILYILAFIAFVLCLAAVSSNEIALTSRTWSPDVCAMIHG